MKAIVFHDVGDIRLEDVKDPKLEQDTDAIVRITTSAICGTDLHFIRGTFPGMKPGTVLGHEAVGVVEEVGRNVRNLRPGDRVVIPSTIGCGSCVYCRAGYYAQCDEANPNGPQAGTAFFGGPAASGPFQGLQSEYARIPFANVGPVKLPESVTDEQAILLSDIFPTGYFGADLAEIAVGDTVAVFGCGPVGQFAILSAYLLEAGRVLAVDNVPSRLDAARELGAEVINFDEEDPVEMLQQLTWGIGPDRVIDAVGVDARCPSGDGTTEAQGHQFSREIEQVQAAGGVASDWHVGNAPTQALQWAVQAVAKAGTLSIIGVYPPQLTSFPVGQAMNKNLTINAGNCNHRRYLPELVRMVQEGSVDPASLLGHREELTSAIDAYHTFDRHEPGWLKVTLKPAA